MSVILFQIIYFSNEFRLKRSQSTEPDLLEKMHNAGKIIMTPCKNLPGSRSISYDDRFVLQAAELNDGAVISNDNFVDLLQKKDGELPIRAKDLKRFVSSFISEISS